MDQLALIFLTLLASYLPPGTVARQKMRIPPTLHVNRTTLVQGEVAHMSCTAPEKSRYVFKFTGKKDSFYVSSPQIYVSSSQYVEYDMPFVKFGNYDVTCSYKYIGRGGIDYSTSRYVPVTVRAIDVKPMLEISPQPVYEGDQTDVSCVIKARDMDDSLDSNINGTSLDSSLGTSLNVRLELWDGEHMLDSSETISFKDRMGVRINNSMVVQRGAAHEFECKMHVGRLTVKTSKEEGGVHAKELFEVPTLSQFPAEVDQGDNIKLVCKSQILAPGRLSMEELSYSLEPLESGLTSGHVPGEFFGNAPSQAHNYTCVAQAHGIARRSPTWTVLPKTSRPKPSVVGEVSLREPFTLPCQCDGRYHWLNKMLHLGIRLGLRCDNWRSCLSHLLALAEDLDAGMTPETPVSS